MSYNSIILEEIKRLRDINYSKKSKFIITNHHAKRAGLHHDIRFELQKDYWESFACRKSIPLEPGIKRQVTRTTIHDEHDALFMGELEDHPEKKIYGAGFFEEYDSGNCYIYDYSDERIKIRFDGKIVKGDYYFIKPKGEMFKENHYLFFKKKDEG